MKKNPRKLLLRTEVVRTLASMDLSLVVGGADVMLHDTGDKMCPGPAAWDVGNAPPKV